MTTHGDVLIIGAGLAGLTAAWQVAAQGKKVRLIAKGWGATHWHSGCLDVLGYYPLDSSDPVQSPAETIEELINENPQHPYALVGLEETEHALQALQTLCANSGYPLEGSLEQNWMLPSAVGTHRPTCLAPKTMIAGDLGQSTPMIIVGFKQLLDFYPNLVSANLSHQGLSAEHLVLDLPSLSQRNFTTSVILANLFEQPDFRQEVAEAVKPHLGPAGRVGFPAVLGMKHAAMVCAELESLLERPVFEIPSLPPSIAGMRLHHILVEAIATHSGRVFDGMEAVSADIEHEEIMAVNTEAAVRQRTHRFDKYILATGGILGGGLKANHLGQVSEVVFDLPVDAPADRVNWFKQDFLDREGHAIYRAGLSVNNRFQPLNGDEKPKYENLFAAGTTLSHCEVIRERSFEGVALTTGYHVGRQLAVEP
jgi:glycerol-3-phosphate dehydrogenase subunit B